MKYNRTAVIVMWVFALLPLAVIAAVYAKLPARIPMQWGIDGTVRYDPKSSIWLMVGLSPALAALFLILPKIDPRKRNYNKFKGIYEGFMVVMMLFLLVMDLVVVSESFYPGKIRVSTVVIVGVGLLFVFLGNVMPKIKNNYFIGIRTPWTLSDPEVWNRSNRLAGRLFFAAGILIALMPLFLSEVAMFVVMMGMVVVISVVPLVMSYIWYRQRTPPEEQ